MEAKGDTAQRILAAAEDLFAGQGYEGASINAIAEAAGVSKANIFHHFHSKEELYLAVLKEVCARSCSHIENLGSDSGPFRQRLRLYALEHLNHLFEHRQVAKLMMRDMLDQGATRGPAFAQEVVGTNFGRLVDILRAGQEKGELRPEVDTALVAFMLVGVNVMYLHSQEMLKHLPYVDFAETPADFSRMALDVLLNGLLVNKE